MTYLFLSHSYEEHSFEGWFHDYLMSVLEQIPESRRPILLERRMLLDLHKEIVFKRAVVVLQRREG